MNPTPDVLLRNSDEDVRLRELLEEAGLPAGDFLWDYRRRHPHAVTVGFVVPSPDGDMRGYIKSYKDEERARDVMSKRTRLKSTESPWGEGVRLLGDGRSILYFYPNDHALRFLRQITSLDKLKRMIAEAHVLGGERVRGRRSSWHLLRYKPEQRVLGRLDLALIDDDTGKKRSLQLFLRAFADTRGKRIARLARHLRQHGLADAIPKQYGVLLDGHLQLEAFRPGVELFEDGGDAAPEVIASLLHRLSAVRNAPCATLFPHELVRQRLLDLDVQDLEELRCLRGQLGGELERQRQLLHPGDMGVVHGDLHSRQFLITDEGVTLVDLERCVISHPALDAGHFAAELTLRSLLYPEQQNRLRKFEQQFLESWQEGVSERTSRGLALGKALGLLAAAARSQRMDVPLDQPHSCLKLLRQALQVLLRASDRPPFRHELRQLFPSGRSPWAAAGMDLDNQERVHGHFDPSLDLFQKLDPREDARLPGLAEAMEEGRLLAWRPGRRAVVVLERDAGVSYLKILPPKKTGAAVRTMNALAPLANQGLTPLLLDSDATRGRLRLAQVPGLPLHDLLQQENAREALEKAATTISRFHREEIKVGLATAGEDDLQGWLDRARQHAPELDRSLQRAFDSLPPAALESPGLLHGDLHDKNIMIHDQGATLIDVEGVRLGSPSRDIGNLVAHFALRARQLDLPDSEVDSWTRTLLDALRQAGSSFKEEDVDREARRSLFRLACVYLFRSPWQTMAANMIKQFCVLLVVFTVLLNTSCVSLVPDDVDENLETALLDGKTLLGTAYLQKKETVEVRGRFEEDRFVAEHIEIEEDDDEIEIKANLTQVNPTVRTVVLGTFTLHVVDDSTLLDEEGRKLTLEELASRGAAYCKAEAIERQGRLNIRKLRLRERGDVLSDELQGRIQELKRSRRTFVLGGTQVKYRRDTPVVWDVEGQQPPALEDRGLRPRARPRLRRILKIDDEDLRQGSGIKLADNITLGGEIQWDLEWRRNHNLRKGRPRDRLIQEPSMKLEFSVDITKTIFSFTKISLKRDWAIFDERIDDQHGSRIGLTEGYIVFLDFPFDGAALEIGRQKFDHGREWVMDDELDGVRLFLNLEPALLEFSVSQKLFDESPEEDGVTNILFGAHMEPFEDSDLFIYALHRGGGRLIDLDRFHTGLSFEKVFDDFTFWADFSYVVGSEDNLDVEGYGFDIMMMYVFSDHDWEPSLYMGFAWGSGDNDLADGKDSSFRQTGLNDNNDKLNGVTSFRYLGELFRPEVSNLMVYTFGFGFLPYRKTSVDFVFHHYEQVEASTILRDTRIRLNPVGLDRTLGNEVDMIIGLEAWEPMEFEIVFGYFRPGSAFGPFQDEAWFMTFYAEFNF